MSRRYKGAVISATPPTTTGGTTGGGSATGVWTLEQQMQAQGNSAWPSTNNFIEDVFSAYLYTGTGSAQTITNGINLSTYGGLIWTKARSNSANSNLVDTTRGGDYYLISNSTAVSNSFTAGGNSAFSFGTTGYTTSNFGSVAQSLYTLVSWTFRKQPKFFDIVTYTGTGGTQAVTHNLGSVPGCIMIKAINSTEDWNVYHRSTGAQGVTFLNLTNAVAFNSNFFPTDPTSTQFYVGDTAYQNAEGSAYIAYIFAHDAGGFGLTGSDNVITCGSYTTDAGATATVNLGYEPQWVLVKGINSVTNWNMFDNMRGMPNDANTALLRANLSASETATTKLFWPTATGFRDNGTAAPSENYIYIAIRRGPMKVPTLGTSVFGLNARTGTGANATVTGSAGVSDAVLVKNRGSAVASLFAARLTGTNYLVTSSDAAQVAAGTTILQANPWDVMDGVKVGTTSTITNASANTFINYLFDRAPGFFDVVCYTGTGSARTVTHNLAAVPEMMIVKSRSNVFSWAIYAQSLGANKYLELLTDGAYTDTNIWNNTAPTASVFSVNGLLSNNSASNIVAYLFATCAGVSKVGSYTGNGSTQTIDCGFGAGGARFVLIKRTDSTGNWYVYDTARGMTLLTDPYWLMNSNAAEAATLGSVTTVSTGFSVDASILAAINTNAANYIFLAIA